jgi:hypothetical protein
VYSKHGCVYIGHKCQEVSIVVCIHCPAVRKVVSVQCLAISTVYSKHGGVYIGQQCQEIRQHCLYTVSSSVKSVRKVVSVIVSCSVKNVRMVSCVQCPAV